MIPYSRQQVSAQDVESVCQALRSEFLTQGPRVTQFQDALATYCGVKHCLAVSNATAALHLACLAVDVGPGDLVLTSPITFVASANCALYCGADIDFVDIDSGTFCLDPQKLEDKLRDYRQRGTKVKAVIAVHFAGQSCDMKALRALANDYQFSLIEDASHALGARYHDITVGSCQYSDITVFSFHPVKMITTGEGGALLTNSDEVNSKVKRLASHGLVREPAQFMPFPEPDWFAEWAYQQQELGFNYRITDIQCALGLSQLTKLDEWVLARNQLAEHYRSLLEHHPIEWQEVRQNCISSFHLMVVLLPRSISRRTVFLRMRDAGFGVNIHYIPVHTQPYYLRLGFALGDFPVAEDYYRRCLSLPLFPDLQPQEVQEICANLIECCDER